MSFNKVRAILNYLGIVLLVALVSCSSAIKFPISSKVPSADITLSTKILESGNHEIIIKANNLASADRLSPARKLYIVWGVTAYEGIRNLGMMSNENTESVHFETLTPFKLTEIFITAEDNGNIAEPFGEEITRLSLPDND